MNSPASEPNSMARALLLGLALGATPAFAVEPTAPAPQPVQAATAQTSEQAKMTVISLCADAGVGSKTLDSATAAVQGGAAYGALDACAALHPIPFPGGNGFYMGGEANGRISDQGWGVSAAEGEVGYDFGRFGFDVGYGAYWDVLDGNRANTNVDGVPHTSLDLYVRPFPETSKASPLTIDLSLGSQWPQGMYMHPAYWSLHLGVGGTWEVLKVNSPAPKSQPKEKTDAPGANLSKPVAVVEAQGTQTPDGVVAAESVAAKPVMSIPELPRFVDLEKLPGLVEAQRAKLEQMVQNFYVSDPGLKAMQEAYLVEGDPSSFPNRVYYGKKKNEDGTPIADAEFETMNPYLVPTLPPRDQASLYLGNLAFRASYTTQDGIGSALEALLNYPYEDTIAFVTALDVYVTSAKEAGFTVDPAVLSEYILLQRMIPQLKAGIDAEIKLNTLRYKAYRLAQAEQKQISEMTYLGANDREACSKNSACIAQSRITQGTSELRKLVGADGNPQAAFRKYEEMLAAAEEGGLLSVEDYKSGYLAYMGVGRVDKALEAAEQLVRRRYSPEALGQLDYIRNNYGLIVIEHTGGGLTNPVFDPTATDAVEYANAELERNGEFNGYLPVGTYTFPDGTTFEVKLGQSNKKVR